MKLWVNHYLLNIKRIDNAPKIAEMVKNSEAKSTEFIDPENVDDLCNKTINYGLTWAKRAETLWEENIENKRKAKEEKERIKREKEDCLIKN